MLARTVTFFIFSTVSTCLSSKLVLFCEFINGVINMLDLIITASICYYNSKIVVLVDRHLLERSYFLYIVLDLIECIIKILDKVIKPFWVSHNSWLCSFDDPLQSVQLWLKFVRPLSFNEKMALIEMKCWCFQCGLSEVGLIGNVLGILMDVVFRITGLLTG